MHDAYAQPSMAHAPCAHAVPLSDGQARKAHAKACTHIHLHIRAQTHARTHTLTHAHVMTHAVCHTRAYTHMHTYTPAHECTQTRSSACTYIIHIACLHTDTHGYPSMCAHTYAVYTNTHTHAHTHTHTHAHYTHAAYVPMYVPGHSMRAAQAKTWRVRRKWAC